MHEIETNVFSVTIALHSTVPLQIRIGSMAKAICIATAVAAVMYSSTLCVCFSGVDELRRKSLSLILN